MHQVSETRGWVYQASETRGSCCCVGRFSLDSLNLPHLWPDSSNTVVEFYTQHSSVIRGLPESSRLTLGWSKADVAIYRIY